MKTFLKKLVFNFIMLIAGLLFPALAIAASIVVIPQIIGRCSDTEMFLVCIGACVFLVFIFALLITVFEKIGVLEKKLKKVLNIN